MQKYNKLWIALAGALAQGVILYFGQESPQATIVISLVTALGVYSKANK
jgi:hypothetical protein